jgi:hypothetical protein
MQQMVLLNVLIKESRQGEQEIEMEDDKTLYDVLQYYINNK